MDKREYLRSLGFTVGERGRFSGDMLKALENFETVEKSDAKAEAVAEAGLDPKVIETPVREPYILHGFDEDGHDIAFILCSRCTRHMMWCKCKDGVHAPSYIVRSADPLVVTAGILV